MQLRKRSISSITQRGDCRDNRIRIQTKHITTYSTQTTLADLCAINGLANAVPLRRRRRMPHDEHWHSSRSARTAGSAAWSAPWQHPVPTCPTLDASIARVARERCRTVKDLSVIRPVHPCSWPQTLHPLRQRSHAVADASASGLSNTSRATSSRFQVASPKLIASRHCQDSGSERTCAARGQSARARASARKAVERSDLAVPTGP
jgi:hypothetical protein